MRLSLEVALQADRQAVWATMSTVGGVNRELAPLVRMTDPTHGAPFDTEPWRTGAPVCWQLVLGVIPFDRHRIHLVASPDGGGFRESSSTWWYRVWWHERVLLDDPAGCIVRDSVEIEARLGLADPIIRLASRWMFRRRHRHLRRRFS